MEFKPWPKIPRFHGIFGRCIITEKIDGTNASILVYPKENGDLDLKIGKRTSWITPDNDNFGFARFVENNRDEFLKLGVGHHFGEWFGNGIQRGYGLREKRFALFNSRRWHDGNPNRPQCSESVKELYSGVFSFEVLEEVTEKLRVEGSSQVPGYMSPEGVVVYLQDIDQMVKWTFDYREGKWKDK